MTSFGRPTRINFTGSNRIDPRDERTMVGTDGFIRRSKTFIVTVDTKPRDRHHRDRLLRRLYAAETFSQRNAYEMVRNQKNYYQSGVKGLLTIHYAAKQ